MPKCTICTHPQREAIDRDLVSQKSFRSVSVRFGVSLAALHRHKKAHIAPDLARLPGAEDRDRSDRLLAYVGDQQAAAAARRAAHSLDLLDEVEAVLARVRKLFDACDRWLADPDEPDRYDLGPRAEEVIVHYTVPGPGGVPASAKAPLSVLLARALPRDAGPSAPAQAQGITPQAKRGALSVDRVELKHADPRELLLKAAHRLEAELQLVGRLVGQLSDPAPVSQTVNVLVASPEWVATRTAILNALAPYPEARAAVVEALANVAPSE